jgi:hypothetical protein
MQRRLFWLAPLLLPFAFYYYTSAPGIGMGDTALLVENAYFLKMSTHAAVHSIAILIGKLFLYLPGYNPARELNLASAFTGGTAILLYGLLLYRVLRSRWIAVGCTGVLAVSHSMWWHSAIAESYAVNALFTVGALWLLFAAEQFGERRLVALFLIAGLSLFNHAQLGIIVVGAACSMAVIAAGKLRERERRVRRIAGLVAACSLAFVIGLIPWLVIFRQDVLRSGWERAVGNLRGSSFRELMFEGSIVKGLWSEGYLLFEQFPGPFLLALLPGLVLLARRYRLSQSAGFFAMLALNSWFFALYNTWDRYAFLLPSFILLAFAGSLAVDAAWSRFPRGRPALVAVLLFSIAFPPWFYAQLSGWGAEGGYWSRRYGGAHHGNILDFAEYRANPNKRHWNDAEEYAELLFETLPKEAIYIGDDSRAFHALNYMRRYYHQRADLKIFMVNWWGFSNWGLGEREFTRKLLDARRNRRSLYLPALRHPFRRWLLPMKLDGAQPRFEIVQLDERRHIYRLLTERELANPRRDASADVRPR